MYDNYHYPWGADNERAPWNEPYVPEKDFDVTCSQSLSRTATVTTNNYIPCCDEGYDDGVGYREEWADTSETNWAKEYEENDYHTPLQLIQMLKGYVEKEAEQYLIDHKDDHLSGKVLPAEKQWQYKALLNLIEECDAWTEDETEICLG